MILDEAAIVHMLKPGLCKTFIEYASDIFIPYILSQLQHQSHLDLVWDYYAKTGSLKATARSNRGKGIHRHVTANGYLSGNWHDFLHVNDNKEELFCFLSRQVIESIRVPGRQLVATVGEQVIAVPPYEDTKSLAPCNHEEADSRMMLHATAVIKCGHRRMDTDVVVLAVWIA